MRRSGLVLRGGAMLTLDRLLELEGRLGRPRLVELTACETGLYDINRNPDEFVGLPATFMQLGAGGVLNTLWQVDDLATALHFQGDVIQASHGFPLRRGSGGRG